MLERMFDLQKVVENWAWDRLQKKGSKKQKKLLKKQRTSSEASTEGPYLQMKIDWSRVSFVDTTRWTKLTDDQDIKGKTLSQDGGTIPEASVLFRTKFENATKDPQEYTMRAQRTTKSTCNTEVERSYTREQELGITLKAPGDVFEANAGFKSEFSLSKVQGEAFEYELEWEVQSQIKVLGRHRAEACMQVLEEKKAGEFEVETKVHGKVIVRFFDNQKNKQILTTGDSIVKIVREHLDVLRCTKDGKKKLGVLAFVEVKDDEEDTEPRHQQEAVDTADGGTQTVEVDDVVDTIKPAETNGETTSGVGGTFLAGLGLTRFRRGTRAKSVDGEEAPTDSTRTKKVFIVSRGSCRFRYGIEQNIKVTQVAMPPLPASTK